MRTGSCSLAFCLPTVRVGCSGHPSTTSPISCPIFFQLIRFLPKESNLRTIVATHLRQRFQSSIQSSMTFATVIVVIMVAFIASYQVQVPVQVQVPPVQVQVPVQVPVRFPVQVQEHPVLV